MYGHLCRSRAFPQAYFNENPDADKLTKLKGDIRDVHNVMISNIGGCVVCKQVIWPTLCVRRFHGILYVRRNHFNT
jgi:hypothetical protein